MTTRTPDTDWMDQAACLNHPGLGWIKEPRQVGPAEEDRMAVICGRCPVLVNCSNYAVATNATAGFWAGSFWTPHGPLLPITGDAA
jgi:hypothetical protein